MGEVWAEIVIIMLLLVANGIFAMSEIAVVAARKVRLRQRAEEGDHRAKAALELAREPGQFLSTVQMGITLVGVLAGAYGGVTIAETLALSLATVPRLAPYAEGVALALVVAIITFFSLIIGELVPKSIALKNPEKIAALVARPMMWLSRIGGPIVRLLTGVTNLVMRLFGLTGSTPPGLSEDEIRAVIIEGAQSGAIEEAESDVVHRVFQLGDQRVSALMTPRVDIEWVNVDATTHELREFLASHSHQQFVVCQGQLDNVVGTVRAADLLPIVLRGDEITLRALVQESLFVPDSMKGFQLLNAFRASHKHVALVMDEFGAVEGLVTATDLLEALVGELPGNAHEAAGPFAQRADQSWLVDGSASMEAVAAKFTLPPLPDDEASAYHTIGGFVMTRLGRVPACADSFEWGGYRFEVVDMDGRRVDKVLVTFLAGAASTEDLSRAVRT
ncbi:MAG: hemolysin family protein [Acidobacteria bacterium]|nr:hemolysin family protein [Acidobacteriota bacterium]